MFERLVRLMATGALVVGALAACSDGQGPTDLSIDSMPETVYADDASRYDDGLTVETASLWAQLTGATLAETTSLESGHLVTMVVGTSGGTITAGEHSLVIPRHAVSEATEFSMNVRAGTQILVDLSARSVATGETVSLFPKPLTLVLSYRGVFSGGDAKRLTNVYLYQDSPDYMVPLISMLSKRDKTISSPIGHFSLYGMAIE